MFSTKYIFSQTLNLLIDKFYSSLLKIGSKREPWGSLKGAPMIQECMVNLELEVKKIIDLESDCLNIGEIINAFSDEHYVVDNHLNAGSLDSFFLTYPDFNYHTLNKHIGKAWQIGKKLD